MTGNGDTVERSWSRWGRAGVALVAVASMLTACTDMSATTPRTRAEAETLSELSVFDDATIEGWTQSTKNVNVEKTGGRYDTGPSTVSQSWIPVAADASIETLIDYLLSRAVSDGYDVKGCDLRVDLGDEGFAALNLSTGEAGFTSTITGRPSTRSDDYHVTAQASTTPCDVPFAPPTTVLPLVDAATTPAAILRERVEAATLDVAARSLTASELQSIVEEHFADLDPSDVRTTTTLDGWHAIAIVSGPLCVYGLARGVIEVWQPVSGSQGEDCTAQQAAEGAP